MAPLVIRRGTELLYIHSEEMAKQYIHAPCPLAPTETDVYSLAKKMHNMIELHMNQRFSGLGQALGKVRYQLQRTSRGKHAARRLRGLHEAAAFLRHLTDVGEESLLAETAEALALCGPGVPGAPDEQEITAEAKACFEETAVVQHREGACYRPSCAGDSDGTKNDSPTAAGTEVDLGDPPSAAAAYPEARGASIDPAVCIHLSAFVALRSELTGLAQDVNAMKGQLMKTKFDMDGHDLDEYEKAYLPAGVLRRGVEVDPDAILPKAELVEPSAPEAEEQPAERAMASGSCQQHAPKKQKKHKNNKNNNKEKEDDAIAAPVSRDEFQEFFADVSTWMRDVKFLCAQVQQQEVRIAALDAACPSTIS